MVTSPRRRLTAGLMCGVAVHAMQAYGVATALPKLTEDLHARGSYGAVITVYLLASVLGLVAGGRRVDRLGLKPTVRAGALWIAAGLFTAAVAPIMPVLLIGRGMQGLGAGLLTTVVYAIVHTSYPRRQWPEVLALLSAAWAVSGLSFPWVLGLIVEYVHWRVVFMAALPLLALTILWVLPSIPDRADDGAETAKSARLLDAVGVVIGASVLLHPVPSPLRFVAVAQALVGVAILSPCVVRLLPEGTLSLRPVLGAAVGGKFLVCMGFFGAEVFVPLALVEVRGYKEVFVGAVLTAATVCWMVAAFVQSRTLGRVGPARMGSAGAVMVLAGVAGMVLLTDPQMPIGWVFLTWGIAAGGMGLVYSTVTDSAMAATAPGREGATGMALGIVDVLGAAAGAGLGQMIVGNFPTGDAGAALGIRAAWGVLVVLTVPALWATARLGAHMESVSSEVDLGPPERTSAPDVL
jgi:MFS family permease